MKTDALDSDSPERYEATALKELTTSEGWRFFLRLIDDEWGAEQTLAKQERALAVVTMGDQAAVHDTVQQIQTARREVLRMLTLPAARLAQLLPAKSSARPFDALRRIGR